MARYFVINKTGVVHTENRPGLGFINISPNSSYECKDLLNKRGEVEVTAKQLAESLVQDSGGHLVIKVVEEEVKSHAPFKVPIKTSLPTIPVGGSKNGTSKNNK